MTVTEKHELDRLYEEKYNYQGCLMKIVGYNDSRSIIVEFQDKYKTKVNTRYNRFLSGEVKNPYHPSVCGVGIVGNKHKKQIGNKRTKEYRAWHCMLQRCFNDNYKEKEPTYKNATCCEEWLLFDNYYEWLHSQPNFDRWFNGKRWAVDKDIFIKRNKHYSPETCCLVPQNVNNLFAKGDAIRGSTLVGVHKQEGMYLSLCNNPFTKEQEYLGSYSTEIEAFLSYKRRKEEIIKQVAQSEYDKNNITKECYEAMMKYEVEIDD